MSIFAFSAGYSKESISGNVISAKIQTVDSGNVQIVKLRVQGSNYVLEPSTLKKGIPVKIEADVSQMPGCSKSVIISEFNIRKTISNSDNFIEFTPDKSGTFNIACSMNMFRGTFTVLESDGSKVAYVQPIATGSSCGAGGGGCGCGGG